MHVGLVVVPQRHDEDHAAVCEGITHSLHATFRGKGIGVAEDRLLVLAEGVGDRVTADASYVGSGLIEDLTTLNVFATDLDEVAVGGVVGSNELSDDSERLGGVDGLARAVECSVAHSERVEVAAVLVTETLVSVTGARSAISIIGAGGVARNTDVWSHGVRDAVRLPDVHLVTARAGVASACVCVVGGSTPALNVGLALDELDILWTLGITVAGTVLGAG